MSRSVRAISLALLVLVVGLFIVTVEPANAAEIRTGSRIVIGDDEVINDDLVISGESVIINGRIKGDLLASGTQVVINGVVEGSAALVGQEMRVNGTIEGSLYSAAYLLELGDGAQIGRNVYYGGYALSTAPGSTVGNSVYIGGYQMLHEGQIGGDLAVGLSALAVEGTVGGDVQGSVSVDPSDISPMRFIPAGTVPATEAVEPGLSIGETAEVGGMMRAEEIIATTPVEEPQPRGFLGMPVWLTNRVGEFIGVMIFGALIIYLLPAFLPTLSSELQEKPLPSLGWGLLMAFIVLPLGIMVGIALVVILTGFFRLVTFGDMTAAVLTLSSSLLGFLLVAYLFVAYVVAKVVVGYWGGQFILSRTSMDPASNWTKLAFLALGMLIYEVLRAIPFFGFALAAVVMFFGVGVMCAYVLDWRRGELPVPPKMATAAGD